MHPNIQLIVYVFIIYSDAAKYIVVGGQDFGSSGNPITTRGADYAHPDLKT